jgi:hypothetical protein
VNPLDDLKTQKAWSALTDSPITDTIAELQEVLRKQKVKQAPNISHFVTRFDYALPVDPRAILNTIQP